MNRPGVWILGELDDKIRSAGLGVTIEYANQKGPAQWLAPAITPWDYTIFGRRSERARPGRRSDSVSLPQQVCRESLGSTLDD